MSRILWEGRSRSMGLFTNKHRCQVVIVLALLICKNNAIMTAAHDERMAHSLAKRLRSSVGKSSELTEHNGKGGSDTTTTTTAEQPCPIRRDCRCDAGCILSLLSPPPPLSP
uniref:Secreted protein n=1 Tax=Plectus sambesii TaxID=2011161 RepID=A0A914XP67_9BILA